jgi:predicted transcriptional regulator
VRTTPDLDELSTLLLGFGHPVRIRIIMALRKPGTVKSPKDLADALAPAPLGVVSYHVRMLVKYGLLELQGTEPRRGALAHYYKLSDQAHDVRKQLKL